MPDTAPILRVGKLHKTGAHTVDSADAHLSRLRLVDPDHVDTARTKLNEWLVGGAGQIAARVNVVMEKAGLGDTKTRKDAVVANDLMLSVSPAWFRPTNPDAAGTWDAERLKIFRREAKAFLREQFGPRVAAAVLHCDEATPHVQAVVVPIVRREDGCHLSGKSYFTRQKFVMLQDAWEKRLKPYGVGPRLKGSKARHVEMKDYYAAVRATPKVPEIVPDPPPKGRLMEGRKEQRERIAGWQKDQATKARRKMRPLTAAAAKGALYDAERRANDALRDDLSEQTRRLREYAADLEEKVELSKEQVAKLRGVPINRVVESLGYTGEIGKRENAIDLVRRVGELDYHGAVAWLYHTFGADAVAAAAADSVRSQLKKNPPELVMTAAEKVKSREITRQLDALAAPGYRLTVMRQVDGKKIGQNLGKLPDGERLFSKDQVLEMIPTMTAWNARGGNIYVTPVDGSARFVLIDDLKNGHLDDLKARGYEPATVVESSPGNFQAVIKVAGDLDEHATNEWFKELNRELGDARVVGLSHPFRLAGLQNRKDKYEKGGYYPFVKVIEAANRFCRHARTVIIEMAKVLKAERSDASLAASAARGAPSPRR